MTRLLSSPQIYLFLANIACSLSVASYYLIVRSMSEGIFGAAYFNAKGFLSILIANALAILFMASNFYKKPGMHLFFQINFVFMILPLSYGHIYISSLNFERIFLATIVYLLFCMTALLGSSLKLNYKVNLTAVSYKKISIVALIIIVLFLLVLYLTASGEQDFSLNKIYSRRIAARDYYQAYPLVRYFPGILAYGLTGFAVYVSGLRGAVIFGLFLVVTVSLFLYWLLGLKSPSVYLILSLFMGTLSRKNQISIFVPAIMLILVLGCLLGLLHFFLTENPFILDSTIRRVYISPVFNVSLYLDLIFESTSWNFLTGESNSMSIGRHVGENYLKVSEANANSNGYIVAIADLGLFGILSHALIVFFLFFVISGNIFSIDKPLRAYLFWMAAFLSIEQSWTTMMLSSGLVLVVALSVLVIQDSSRRIC